MTNTKNSITRFTLGIFSNNRGKSPPLLEEINIICKYLWHKFIYREIFTVLFMDVKNNARRRFKHPQAVMYICIIDPYIHHVLYNKNCCKFLLCKCIITIYNTTILYNYPHTKFSLFNTLTSFSIIFLTTTYGDFYSSKMDVQENMILFQLNIFIFRVLKVGKIIKTSSDDAL